MIHPTASVHPQAQVDPTCDVGAFAVIDAHVVLGPNCRVGPHVHLTGHTTIGAHNRFHAGAVIGDAPQDLRYADAPTRLQVGEGNVFREQVTVNRSNKVEEDTRIGSHCYFMACSHVGHNTVIGDHVILANGATLGGHVTIQDRAFLSGHCLVHQFTRVGTLALMQGRSAISKDIPPFTIARGVNHIRGLNVVGLRRAGFLSEQRLELRRLYHAIFRRPLPLRTAVAEARETFTSVSARILLDFIGASTRGVCAEAAGGHGEDETDV